ncbi:hypothetical protein BT96DRAFT_833362 [Gymnopus androsaceus JB14]|uniref:Uncharacterized protein n=1 Tax=Gymnopus androsaceus JB14 TaxID=1447944 RepID=A0A6A4GXP9_9AGAR|nr:hypothetical protein BT96DRAFT_833362 [Gymnopus androsaceus JB14]
MVSLARLVQVLSAASVALSNILLSQIIAFVLLCSCLKNNILLIWPSTQDPMNAPPILPNETNQFLQNVCNMDHSDIEAQWNAVKDDIWHPDEILQGIQNDNSVQQMFKLNGGQHYYEFNSSVDIFSNQ